MPTSVRFEVFPADLEKCIAFYTDVLRFTILQRKDGYAYFQRDRIFIGAADQSNFEWADVQRVDRSSRKSPIGVEIVIEVDDLEAERDWVVRKGWTLDADIKLQSWGLRDFRIMDPDGFYLRVTEHISKGQREAVEGEM